jgi:hypothetical protein
MSQQIPQIKAHEVTSCIYNFHVNALGSYLILHLQY